jgi:hypothetical protein
MPGVPSVWSANSDAPLSAGRLNYDLYTYDSNQFHPTGLNFHTFRPLFYEVLTCYVATNAGQTAAQSSLGGTATNLQGGGSDSGTNTNPTAYVLYDTSGMWGAGADYIQGQYQFLPTVAGSDGQGAVGGYYVCCHFSEYTGSNTDSLYCGADYGYNQGHTWMGGRQSMSETRNNTPMFMDLIPFGPNSPNSTISATPGQAATPYGWVQDSGSNAYTLMPNSTGGTSAGELSRHFAFWASVIQNSAWGAQSTCGSPQVSWPVGTAITSSLMQTAVEEPLQWLGNPVSFRAAATAAQTFTSGTAAVVQFASGTIYNANSNWSSSTYTFTVPVAGLYLFHGVVSMSATANAGGFVNAGATITPSGGSATTYWGPSYPQLDETDSGNISALKTQIFSLGVGDKVQLSGYQNSGASIATSTANPSRFFLLWLGGNGATTGGTIGQPNTTLTVPDPSFRFQAGTPGAVLQQQIQQRLGNDLNWFFNKPYFMGYQTTAFTLAATGVWSGNFPFQSQTGVVHGDAGDPWSGWSTSTNEWTAPASGWYLVTHENTVVTTAATTSVTDIIAGLGATTSGAKSPSVTPDWFQHILCSLALTTVPAPTLSAGGAAASNLYYLKKGESLFAQALTHQSSGTSTTKITTGTNWSAPHMEIVWMGS